MAECWYVTCKDGDSPFNGVYIDKTVHEAIAQALVDAGKADWYMCVIGEEPDLDALNAPMLIEITVNPLH